MTSRLAPSRPRRVLRVLAEPVVHFFALGLLLFAAHRAFVGTPRTVVVTRAVKAELARRFQDANGREPTATELTAEVHKWRTDEALFREGLREHLDRDDPGIRTIVVDKMRLRAAFQIPRSEPTAAELDAWLASHRNLYDTPPRYDFEFIAFSKTDRRAEAELEELGRAIQQGKSPSNLGRPVVGGDLSLDDMKGRVEPELAGRIARLPVGAWQRIETPQSLFFARVKSVDGGRPTREQLGGRLIADWKRAAEREATDRLLQRTLDHYRFEEEP